MSVGGEAGQLADRVDELGQRIGHMTTDDVQSLSWSLMDQRQRGDESPELLATALALSREALQRTVGVRSGSAVIGAVSTALTGVVPTIPAKTDRQAAIVMALHWQSLSGRGVHFVSWDQKSARTSMELFGPVGRLLGCSAGLVSPSMTRAVRRSAYGAMVTFGAWPEMVADYLRDNLHRSHERVAQRELCTAVVDDVNGSLVTRALEYGRVTAPSEGSLTPSPGVQGIADSFRKGREYRVVRKWRRIAFSGSAMLGLKSAVGWSVAPSLKAVSMAERVEGAIARREGIDRRRGGRDTLAEVTVQGYLRAYELLIGFSADGEPDRTIDDILADGMKVEPSLRELTFERVLDAQRSKIYGYRVKIRDEPDTLSLLGSIVTDAVQVWLSYGTEALMIGLHDILAGHESPEQIDEALSGSLSQGDISRRAYLCIEKAIEWRKDALGESQASTLFQEALLTVIDMRWREHVRCVRFLQRQSYALYHLARNPGEARNVDIEALFADCEQLIRVESIKYLLGADPTAPAR